MSPSTRDVAWRAFRVTIRDHYYTRLYEMALEARMEPKDLASMLIERAARRWKPKPERMPQTSADEPEPMTYSGAPW